MKINEIIDPEDSYERCESCPYGEQVSEQDITEIGNSPYKFHYSSRCTRDCSGHAAGWRWGRQKAVTSPADCVSRSPSFTRGCIIGLQYPKVKYPTIQGPGGRFTSLAKIRLPRKK